MTVRSRWFFNHKLFKLLEHAQPLVNLVYIKYSQNVRELIPIELNDKNVAVNPLAHFYLSLLCIPTNLVTIDK